MSRQIILLATLLSLLYSHVVLAAAENISKYKGQQSRVIKSLSKDDMQQLNQGKGWGLAKAAELNGVPGPVHLLQMKQQIALSKDQIIKIKAIFNDMQSKAIPLGKKLIQLESKLNDSFANRKITAESLSHQLDDIARVTKELRYVHLVAHLATPSILSEFQITKYNKLRGYGDGDPCKNIPMGHNEDLWKKHNGCS